MTTKKELEEKIKAGEQAIKSFQEKIIDLEAEKNAEISKPKTEAVNMAAVNREIEKCHNTIASIERNIFLNQAHIKRIEDEEKEKARLLTTIPDLSEMQRLSKLVSGHLEAALEANQRLRALQDHCQHIKEKTGKRISRPGCTMGFYSLKLLVDVCRREMNGGGRSLFEWGQVPVNLRRL